LYSIAQIKDKEENTPLHYAATENNAAFIEHMARKLKSEQFQKLMKIRNDEKKTPLHEVAEHPDNREAMRAIFDRLAPEAIYQIAQMRTIKERTPLHLAALKNNGYLIEMLSEKLKANQMYQLADMTNDHGNSPLTTIAEFQGNEKAMRAFFNAIKGEHLRKLAVAEDAGTFPVAAAIINGNELFIREIVEELDPQSVEFMLQKQVQPGIDLKQLASQLGMRDVLLQSASKKLITNHLYNLYHHLNVLQASIN